MCAVCDKHGFYFDPATDTCASCDEDGEGRGGWRFSFTPEIIVFVVIVGFAVAAAIVSSFVWLCGGEILIQNLTTRNLNTASKKLKDAFKEHVLTFLGCLSKDREKKKMDKVLGKVKKIDPAVVTNVSTFPDEDNGTFTVEVLMVNPDVKSERDETMQKTTSNAVYTTTTTIITTISSSTRMTIKPSSPLKAFTSSMKELRVQAKALAAFFQIGSYIGFNFSIAFPSLVEKIFKFIAVVNLDIIPSLGLQCSFEGFDYISTVTLVTLTPIAVTVLLIFVYFVVSRDRHSKLEEQLVVPANLQTSFQCPAELKRLRETFAAMDADGSGYVSNEELEVALRNAHGAAQDDDSTESTINERVSRLVDAAKAAADHDDDQGLSFGNFLAVMLFWKLSAADKISWKNPTTRRRKSSVGAFMESRGDSFGQAIFYVFLLLTFLVLISTSTALFHYLKVRPRLVSFILHRESEIETMCPLLLLRCNVLLFSSAMNFPTRSMLGAAFSLWI
mmetsp:Transcript_86907/g.168334  ORF Transcript_86907/g.168334 Transcript_86907/m.168334 type:complete len:503 (-) Transcript_86907:1300-2808(-)